MRRRHTATGLCLILVLISTLSPKAARADDGSGESPILLGAGVAFGPIGRVYSLGPVMIDGRKLTGEQILWGGELIEVTSSAGGHVVLDSIGEVTLRNGTGIRLSRVPNEQAVEAGVAVLMISLIAGEARVKLQDGKGARIQIAGSKLVSSAGAWFRLGFGDGQPKIEAERGSISLDSNEPQRKPVVIRVYADPLTAASRGTAPKSIKATTRQKVPLHFQIGVTDMQTRKTTPLGAGKRVTVTVLTPGAGEVGSQTVTVITNQYGIATATFTAGANPASTDITATDEETRAEWQGSIIVAKPAGLWTPILIGAVAAAVIVIIVHPHSGPLKQELPPRIP